MKRRWGKIQYLILLSFKVGFILTFFLKFSQFYFIFLKKRYTVCILKRIEIVKNLTISIR